MRVQDGDVSIRRRALDLIYSLVNKDNIEALAKELLAYLAVTDAAFKPSLTEHLSTLVQRFSPTDRWYVDNILTIMVSADVHVKVRASSCGSIPLIVRGDAVCIFAVAQHAATECARDGVKVLHMSQRRELA